MRLSFLAQSTRTRQFALSCKQQGHLYREGLKMLPKTTAVWVTSLFAGLTWAQTELNQATEIDLDGLKGLARR